jgi:hypothetical protein
VEKCLCPELTPLFAQAEMFSVSRLCKRRRLKAGQAAFTADSMLLSRIMRDIKDLKSLLSD